MVQLTLSDFAFLANDVYLNPGLELALPRENSQRCQRLLNNTETVINSDPHGPKANGFFARVYKYKQGNKTSLIVAYRGTSNVEDYLIDAELASGQAIEQGKDAINFCKEAIIYANSHHIKYEDIYITGHSLGGGLAQWVSMLTVDYPQLFGIKPTAFRTVTFNPPGMQGIDPNGKAPHYAEIAHTISQHKVASGGLAAAMALADPEASLVGATEGVAVVAKKIVELLNYQTAIKNRSVALRMGQGALIFLWDLLMPDRSGLPADKEINNPYPHIYNISSRYDLVHCSGNPGGNLINYDIDPLGKITNGDDDRREKFKYQFLENYFEARQHYLKHGVNSAKMKSKYEQLSKADNWALHFENPGKEGVHLPTAKDWENYFKDVRNIPEYQQSARKTDRVMQYYTGTLSASQAYDKPYDFFVTKAAKVFINYLFITEHSMANMLPSIQVNRNLAEVNIGYNAHETILAMRKCSSLVKLHTTERLKGPLVAARDNVQQYQKKGVYPYNQTNYQAL
ncbi:Mbeg1-like protein [Piscirickettsia salmonis]|uniref:Mbeg1-like protein n=1 Tax=Piscirickettsia salmonis TaxID=1238 RepID=UPI0007C97F3B|nr:hypothetical protein A0O36_02448 [Piscirickettsiaceae bacterium NZ-RLO1]